MYESFFEPKVKIDTTAKNKDTILDDTSPVKEEGDIVVENKLDEEEAKEGVEKGIEDIYESEVTKKYFENWDRIEIEGNPGIKEKIKENILKREKECNMRYKTIAERWGLSIEDLKQYLQEQVEKIVSASSFFRATEVGILDKVLNADGRFKSQFETNTSGGSLNPAKRIETENVLFGFNKNIDEDKERRPIYGYFSDNEHGGINKKDGNIPPPTLMWQYGKINIKFKKEAIIKKSTILFNDSFTDITKEFDIPTFSAKPHFTSFIINEKYWDDMDHPSYSSIVKGDARYTEVQYHNQLTIEDIESIHISENNELSNKDMAEINKSWLKFIEKNPDTKIKLVNF